MTLLMIKSHYIDNDKNPMTLLMKSHYIDNDKKSHVFVNDKVPIH